LPVHVSAISSDRNPLSLERPLGAILSRWNYDSQQPMDTTLIRMRDPGKHTFHCVVTVLTAQDVQETVRSLTNRITHLETELKLEKEANQGTRRRLTATEKGLQFHKDHQCTFPLSSRKKDHQDDSPPGSQPHQNAFSPGSQPHRRPPPRKPKRVSNIEEF
jgi:hypothetical protein